MKSTVKRSPLKEQPLRHPGQSLDEQLAEIRVKRMSYWFFFLCVAVLAFYEWWHWYRGIPPQPILAAIVAFGVGVYSYYMDRKLKTQAKDIKLGSDGEKIVGQALDDLRHKGYAVFHDIVNTSGAHFNIDHAVVSTHGIFAIETKTHSKPARGKAEVNFDGKQITINGMKPDRDPIQQALANANWLRDVLHQSTGKFFPVKPVIVYPGWFVTNYAGSIWVLNPKALPGYIDQEKLLITQEDTHLAAFHLTRLIKDNFPKTRQADN